MTFVRRPRPVAESHWKDRSARLYEWLNAQPIRVRGLKEPWTLRRGSLMGYGFTRARFVASFETSQQLSVEVEASGGQIRKEVPVGVQPEVQRAVVGQDGDAERRRPHDGNDGKCLEHFTTAEK